MATDNDDDAYKPSTGRLARFAKLASLSAKLSTDAVSRGVKRLARGAQEAAEGEAFSVFGLQAAEKLVETLGDLKGLAMKVGQSMAMDPDLLTPEIRAVIAKLQNQAPPMPFATVREVVESALGRPLNEAYASFEETALAAASLGQVHRAVLHDGTKVAVKVQYPDIAKALHSDLENVGAMVRVISASTRLTQGKEYFAEMRDALLDELDYRAEGERSKLYQRATHGCVDLVVPKVFDSHTADRVLTLELLEGMTVKEFLAEIASRSNDERFRASRALILAMWVPFLNEGVIHADPHPGNFMLLPDGRLGVFDFGAVKQMSDGWLTANRRLFGSIYGEKPYDPIGESLDAGMEFTDPENARAFVQSVLDIATRGAQTEGEFSYQTAGINRDMKTLFMTNPMMVRKVKPPKEALQFLRGIAGMNQNLENIGARGDFRTVYRDAYETSVRLGRRCP